MSSARSSVSTCSHWTDQDAYCQRTPLPVAALRHRYRTAFGSGHRQCAQDLQNTLEQEIKIEEQKETAAKYKAEEDTASAAVEKHDDQDTAPPRETVSRS
jgi:hypothetical protein